jgi:hypothetical protein
MRTEKEINRRLEKNNEELHIIYSSSNIFIEGKW